MIVFWTSVILDEWLIKIDTYLLGLISSTHVKLCFELFKNNPI